jgi:asparagine synthase (glutamine-hydrolysing)
VRDLLPAEVMNRPKRGFSPPVRQWHDALFARHGTLLADGHLVVAGILERRAAQELAKGPVSPGAVTPISFKALVLETWCREMSAL